MSVPALASSQMTENVNASVSAPRIMSIAERLVQNAASGLQVPLISSSAIGTAVSRPAPTKVSTKVPIKIPRAVARSARDMLLVAPIELKSKMETVVSDVIANPNVTWPRSVQRNVVRQFKSKATEFRRQTLRPRKRVSYAGLEDDDRSYARQPDGRFAGSFSGLNGTWKRSSRRKTVTNADEERNIVDEYKYTRVQFHDDESKAVAYAKARLRDTKMAVKAELNKDQVVTNGIEQETKSQVVSSEEERFRSMVYRKLPTLEKAAKSGAYLLRTHFPKIETQNDPKVNKSPDDASQEANQEASQEQAKVVKQTEEELFGKQRVPTFFWRAFWSLALYEKHAVPIMAKYIVLQDVIEIVRSYNPDYAFLFFSARSFQLQIIMFTILNQLLKDPTALTVGSPNLNERAPRPTGLDDPLVYLRSTQDLLVNASGFEPRAGPLTVDPGRLNRGGQQLIANDILSGKLNANTKNEDLAQYINTNNMPKTRIQKWRYLRHNGSSGYCNYDEMHRECTYEERAWLRLASGRVRYRCIGQVISALADWTQILVIPYKSALPVGLITGLSDFLRLYMSQAAAGTLVDTCNETASSDTASSETAFSDIAAKFFKTFKSGYTLNPYYQNKYTYRAQADCARCNGCWRCSTWTS